MTLYDDLEVGSNSSSDDIKKAYRKLALKHHPDRGGNEEEFKRISKAYEILSDEQKRRQYDHTGDDGSQPQRNPFGDHFNPFGDHFNPFGGNPFGNFPFGGHQRRHQEQPKEQLPTVDFTMNITLDDLYHGVLKRLLVHIEYKCVCNTFCGGCNGKGVQRIHQQIGPVIMSQQIQCQSCHGSCFNKNANCSECKGSGKNTKQEVFEILIPKASSEQWTKVIPGKGKQAFLPHELPGDLRIRLNLVPHSKFKKEEKNLIYETPISYIDALCGKEVSIPHFDGEYTFHTYKQFGTIIHGSSYNIPDKGFDLGSLIIRFTIDYPKNLNSLSEEQRELLRNTLTSIF